MQHRSDILVIATYHAAHDEQCALCTAVKKKQLEAEEATKRSQQKVKKGSKSAPKKTEASRIDVCIDMCIGMCVDMCLDTCADM